MLSAQARAAIDKWVAKFPVGRGQSAVLAALHIVQEENGGFLTNELIEAVATYLDLPVMSVYEVTTFYSMYDQKPVGRNKIYLCTNISCQLRGAQQLKAFLEEKLEIQCGESTPDGKFYLKEFECIGACTGAPALMLNKDYHENLTQEKLTQILAEAK